MLKLKAFSFLSCRHAGSSKMSPQILPSEPIYQNVASFSQQKQVLFYQEQLEKQQRLLDHQELLQKQRGEGNEGANNVSVQYRNNVSATAIGGSTSQTTQTTSHYPVSHHHQGNAAAHRTERRKWGAPQDPLVAQSLAFTSVRPDIALSTAAYNSNEESKTIVSVPCNSTVNGLANSVEVGTTVVTVSRSNGYNNSNNPLSNSVDSTKSSPPSSGDDKHVVVSPGQLRSSESLNTISKIVTSSSAQNILNKSLPSAGSVTIISNSSPNSKLIGSVTKVGEKYEHDTTKLSDKSVPSALSGNSGINHKNMVPSESSTDAVNVSRAHLDPRTPTVSNSTMNNASLLSSTPHNSSIMARIYAARDPRARQLQNELLSAELPMKYESIALSKPNAVFAGMSEAHIGSNVPYADNKVSISPSSDNKEGCINASHITASVGRNKQVFYIVHAMPRAVSVSDIWNCVWEHDIRLVVVMATCLGAQENNSQRSANSKESKASRLLSSFNKRRSKRSAKQQKTKEMEAEKSEDEVEIEDSHGPLMCGTCFPYWPQFNNTSIECGNYRIYRRDSTESDGYTICRLQMQHRSSKSSRIVWHIQYCHGLTNTRTFIELIEQLSSLREVSQQEASADATTPGINVNAPVLLQCPSDIEHCGAIMMCDLLVGGASLNTGPGSRDNTLRGGGVRDAVTILNNSATSGEGTVTDPAKILPHLRQQRANLLPSFAAFTFVYKVMIEYFGRSRLI